MSALFPLLLQQGHVLTAHSKPGLSQRCGTQSPCAAPLPKTSSLGGQKCSCPRYEFPKLSKIAVILFVGSGSGEGLPIVVIRLIDLSECNYWKQLHVDVAVVESQVGGEVCASQRSEESSAWRALRPHCSRFTLCSLGEGEEKMALLTLDTELPPLNQLVEFHVLLLQSVLKEQQEPVLIDTNMSQNFCNLNNDLVGFSSNGLVLAQC